MISLPLLLTKARRFVDGVCAIPRFASMERLEEIHEAHRKATQIRSELGIDETGLIQQLAAERKRHAEYFVETENQLTVLRGLVATVTEQRNAHWLDLSAEREAHAATRERFRRSLVNLGVPDIGVCRFLTGDDVESDTITARDHDIIDQINARQAAERELSVARADLEALTRWRLQSEEPCPLAPDVDVSLMTERYGVCLDRVSTMIATDIWRHTPESLAAWKAREGGGVCAQCGVKVTGPSNTCSDCYESIGWNTEPGANKNGS